MPVSLVSYEIGWLALDSNSAVGTLPTRWLGQSHVGRPQNGASQGGPLEGVELGGGAKSVLDEGDTLYVFPGGA